MLRRTLALALSLSIGLMAVPLSAVPSSPGRISGIATTVSGGQFAGQIARLRSLDIGHVAGVTTTTTAGSFAFNGVSSGNYVVELMTDGRVVGTSTPIAVTAKNNIVDGVSARAVAPAAQAQSGALAGSFWGSTIGIITAIVIVAVVVTVIVVATNDEASPSR
jgi:hypothetical protein